MTDTFYDVLGVGEDASESEIEAAYRERIKETHPDVSDEVNAAEKTKRLNKAKDVLTDDAERQRYDRIGHAAYVRGDGPFGDDARNRATDDDGSDTTTADDQSVGGEPTEEGRKTGDTSGGWNPEESGFGSSPGGFGNVSGQSSSTSGSSGFSTDRGTGQRRDRASRRAAQDAAAEAAGWTESDATNSASAKRQAAANDPDREVGNSWNAWDTTRSYAVHRGGDGFTPLQVSYFIPERHRLPLVVLSFFLYPILLFSSVFPRFPIVVNVVVGLCTLLTVFYLLSVPRVAFTVFGGWSVLATGGLLVLPGVGLLSVVGVFSLATTWLPFGLSILLLSVVRP